MQWAGAGLVWTFKAGIPTSSLLADTTAADGAFSFVQISDSHIGFNKPANSDVISTLRAAMDRINALPARPDFMIHTGDLSHGARANEFDDLEQVLKDARTSAIYYVPGEHDTLDDGKLYKERFVRNASGATWYSFDHRGVHFLALNNCAQLDGLGQIGPEQLTWMKNDLAALQDSTPIVVFAHIPLWSVYPRWGWGTGDGEHALGLLRRFGSVTVLNGHIHQVMQKAEGNVAFHTAASTAFPQPAPGTANAAGPMVVPAGRLRSVLGVTSVAFVPGTERLAIVDAPLLADRMPSDEK
jgi:3',5'-cyclic AMP phosphodiesterase CpdA